MDGAEEILSPEDAFGVLGMLCRDYVISDQRLLTESLETLNAQGLFGIPVIYNSPKLQVRLTFDSSVSEGKTVFRLLKRKRSERVAELDIGMQLTPASEYGSSEVHRVAIHGTWAPFFEEPVPGSNVMKIRLSGGTVLPMRLPGDDGADADPTWGPELMGPMLLTLADWVRDGDRSAPAPQNVGSSGPLDHLLVTLVKGTDTLLRDTAAILRPGHAVETVGASKGRAGRQLAEYRERIAATLGPEFTAYRLADLTSRLKLVLDENGKLSTDPFSGNAQRYDIRARLDSDPSHPRIVCALQVPDLLVSGSLYDHMLTALAKSEALTELGGALRTVFEARHLPSQSALIAFIEDARTTRRAVIARIDRASSEHDMDLMLLRGLLAGRESWLLVSATVAFEDKEAAAEALRVKQFQDFTLVAWKIGNGDWKPGPEQHERAREYFSRTFLSLYRWRLRFGPLKGA